MKDTLYRLKKVFDLIFMYPANTIKGVTTDYDTYWRDKRGAHLGLLSPWQKDRADLLVGYLHGQVGVSLVDVGCGDGSILRYVRERADVKKAIGADVSAVALQKAKELGVETVLVDINVGKDADMIPQADYVLLFEILEHIQDSELFLSAMLGRAHKGVFFSFPNTGYFAHRLRLMFGKFPMQWRVHPREHVRFWTYADVYWWLRALGFQHYEVKAYRGVPLLNRVWPALFAAGLFVFLPVQK